MSPGLSKDTAFHRREEREWEDSAVSSYVVAGLSINGPLFECRGLWAHTDNQESRNLEAINQP